MIEISAHKSALWYAVATKPRREADARLNLARQGYSVCLPQITLRKRRRGQWGLVTEAMFPGYLFVALVKGVDDPAPIRSTIGCYGLVRSGSVAVPVPDEVMVPLLALDGRSADARQGFAFGERVRFEAGPFAGLEAIFQMPKGEDRAQVLIALLGQQRSLVVDSANIGPV
jgi:transcriptional antiterminator RfaH